MNRALSADTKDALAREVPEAPEDRAALLDGLARYGAVDGVLRTQRLAIARLAANLVALAGETPPKIERRERTRLVRGSDFFVPVPATSAGAEGKRKRGERRSELRAAFLACGSIAEPARGYHLEFTARTSELAERIVRLIRGEGHVAKTLARKGRTVVYLKDIDAIVAVLGALGAYGAVLRLEDVRAVKETKNRIRRLVNTEVANVDRAANAAAAQRDRIAFLADAYGLANLSPVLREVAELRLAHPTETLGELGRLCDPEVKKSTVNGRIAALLRLAEHLAGPAREPAAAATPAASDGSPGRLVTPPASARRRENTHSLQRCDICAKGSSKAVR